MLKLNTNTSNQVAIASMNRHLNTGKLDVNRAIMSESRTKWTSSVRRCPSDLNQRAGWEWNENGANQIELEWSVSFPIRAFQLSPDQRSVPCVWVGTRDGSICGWEIFKDKTRPKFWGPSSRGNVGWLTEIWGRGKRFCLLDGNEACDVCAIEEELKHVTEETVHCPYEEFTSTFKDA